MNSSKTWFSARSARAALANQTRALTCISSSRRICAMSSCMLVSENVMRERYRGGSSRALVVEEDDGHVGHREEVDELQDRMLDVIVVPDKLVHNLAEDDDAHEDGGEGESQEHGLDLIGLWVVRRERRLDHAHVLPVQAEQEQQHEGQGEGARGQALRCSSFHSLAMNILRQADTGAFIMWPCGVVVALGFSQSRKKMS